MSSPTTSTSAAASSSSAARGSVSVGSNLKIVGIILAVCSGFLIGASFVFKKKGLLRSQAGHAAGEGVAYLKSPLWWTGMIMMILGEICNFAAYAFIEALVVTPLGALSVVVCAILSSIFLKEKLTFFGWLGCALCIIGSVIIALNGPQEETISQITDFQKLFLAPGFLAYGGVLFLASFSIMFYFGPKYGKKSMLWYIAVCSMIGGISVSVSSGLGAAIVTTASGDNQFKHWFMYFLLVFVAATLITEVYYLNMALALFNTAMVTPTYYVIFTFCSMVTTVVLFQGLKASAMQIITVVMGFLVICLGITILQMSKVDPTQLNKLDRKSTILLQAARSNTEIEEKSISGFEDPGMDALRGSFGTVGSIIRARSARRMSQSSSARRASAVSGRSYDPERGHPYTDGMPSSTQLTGLTRHQLYDPPMPSSGDTAERVSMRSQTSFGSNGDRRPTIKFDNQDLVHQYHIPGTGDNSATHEHRSVLHSPKSLPFASPDRTALTKSPIQLDEQMQGSSVSRPPNDGSFSAPPLPGAQFFQPPRIDPFANAPATTTLASFPSTSTVSIESVQESPLGAKDREREKEETRRHYHRYSKGYPKTGDDREESMSLWRPSEDESESDDIPEGGIRLVPGRSASHGRI